MRDQAVVHKVGNRSGIAGQRRTNATAQKPKRRESSGEGLSSRLRGLLSYFPSLLKVVLVLVIAGVVFASYRAAASASFFKVRSVEVQGNSRVSTEQIQSVVRQQAEKTGVWKADLDSIAASVEKLPWVRTAVVSRVLPDGIRVRVGERVPLIVVRTSSGRFRWVDADAVMLGEMQPSDQVPSFFLRGLNEEDSEAARAENYERVQKFRELQQSWDAAGLAERVSEVNLFDLHDVRVQLAGDTSQIEVRLGAQDHAQRLKEALDVLDKQRQTPRGGLISYIDMSPGKRAIVGLTTGAHSNDDPAMPAMGQDPTIAKPASAAPLNAATVRTNPDTPPVESASRNSRPKSPGADKKNEKPKELARRRA